MTQQAILIVSSERREIDMAESTIQDDCLHVISVHSYREAVITMARQHVALLLCDEALVDGSWKDLLGQMAMMPEPPRLVLLVSAANPTVLAEALDLGAYDALSKPLGASDLRQLIARAVPPQPTGDGVFRGANAA